MTVALFDSHAHLTMDLEVVQRARQAGVIQIMNVAVDGPSLEIGYQLAQEASSVTLYQAAATTPHDVRGEDDPFFHIVEEAAKCHRLSAIGETGFEAFHTPHNLDHQEAIFLRYVQLAITTTLPLIVHCRDAFDRLLRVVHTLPLKGILHCFTGTKEQARALLDLGWYISFSGIVTFPKAEELREVAKFVPLDRLLVETDAPFLAPQPKRGQKNEPAFLVHTVETLSSVKNLPFETVAEKSCENANRLFGNQKI